MKRLSILIFIATLVVGLLILNSIEPNDKQVEGIDEGNDSEEEVADFFTNSEGNYAISTSSKIASEVGLSVLEKGGNAIDAAIAASYVLGVVEPYGSGLGGGGGMVLKMHNKEEPIFIDYRNLSDQSEEVRQDNSGIPSFVLGMDYLSKNYGTIPINNLIEPAINLAKDGAEVSNELASYLEMYAYWIGDRFEPGYPNGEPLQAGETIVQPDLAKVLQIIRDDGVEAFYGYIQKEVDHPWDFDFEKIKDRIVEEKDTVSAKIGEYTYYAAPDPFSGITLLQLLKARQMLQLPIQFSEDKEAYLSLGRLSNNINSYRMNNVADPHFKKRQDGLGEDLLKSFIEDENTEPYEEEEAVSTTHLSIIDAEGNAVSMTNTIGDFWGNKNNELGFFNNSVLENFSEKSYNPNIYEPFKKPRTFMSPTIVQNESEILAIGSPGGSRIPQLLAQVLAKYTHGVPLNEAVEDSRFYFENNQIVFEDFLDPELSLFLSENGYYPTLNEKKDHFGGVNAVGKKDEKVFGVADPRRSGTVLEGD